ncbi:MAG: hypothetical protein H7Y11_14120, partial [Armatimonadetes bacterium]|nr:hypothetical protein [Anaerolineae bacterium]
VPLWDYAAALDPLVNFGLDTDGVHPSIPPMGTDGAADFHDYNLPYGYVMRNLTALQQLDLVWRVIAMQPL